MIYAEYVRDMHNNYLVLRGVEGSSSSYGTKMILNNKIPGLVNAELRCIDKTDLFYYDVTSKRAVYEIYENKLICYEEMKKLLVNILETIALGGDYLLSENDFILEPKYIFIDNETNEAKLCHLVGNQENIREQLIQLMEYLMNKVDYKEERAVLLIYALYKASKEVDCTFQMLLNELNKKNYDAPVVKKVNIETQTRKAWENGSVRANLTDNQNRGNKGDGSSKNIIFSKENKKENLKGNNKGDIRKQLKKELVKENKRGNNLKFWDNSKAADNSKALSNSKSLTNLKPLIEIDNEREISFYSIQAYILAGGFILAGIAAFAGAIWFKLLRNSFGTGIDLVKASALIIIIGCIEAYIMIKLFDKNNRRTRIKTSINTMEQPFGEMENNRKLNNQDMLLYSKTPEKTDGNKKDEKKLYVDNAYEINKEEDYNCKRGTEYNYEKDTEREEEYTQLLWSEDYEEGKTVILSGLTNYSSFYLQPLEEVNTQIPICKYPFLVGKSKETDYVLKDSSVSRKHGKFTKEGDNIYLWDLGSTNGTYVNSIKLSVNTPYLLTENDEIAFSQVKFLWKKN